MIIAGKDRVTLSFERAFVAIGQAGNLKYGVNCALATTPRGFIAVDPNGRTGMQGVYAAGDAATGPSSVVRAMASGRHLAREVHRNLSGEDFLQHLPQRPEDRDFRDIASDLPSLARSTMPERQPAGQIWKLALITLMR